MNDLRTKALDFHKGGKLAIASKVKLDDRADLSLAYSPGVAYPCLEIAANPEDAYRYTSKKTRSPSFPTVGRIGLVTSALAAIPVMEGKCLLFKKFAGIDAIPIVLATKDTEEIIRTVQILAPSFGGINLEDIAFPRCVEIERRLIETLDIPVFHDDQRGTAVVTAAALISACKLVDKKFSDLRVAILGLGAAGTSIARLLKAMGIGTIYACNSRGIVTRKKPLSPFVLELLDAGIIDSYDDYKEDSIAEIMTGADVFIGVSRGNLLSVENVNRMADRPIVFALANPDPEISLEKIRKTKAYIYATGRSDYPNQINNVLAFPGIFRGALDAGFKKITESMCIAAARAIAGLVAPERLSPDYIIPSVFEADVVRTVSEAIKQSEETK